MPDTLTRRLARILRRPVDAATRARAAQHVVDWLGCAIIGATEPAGDALRQYAPALGRGPCHAILAEGGLPAAGAAFVNGGLGNVLEMDDVHRAAILHPGPVVIPAALAAGQSRGASGTALLDAVVRGYEAVIRVGRSVGPGHYAQWHNTASCGPFGAAAAAGDLLGLGEDAMVWALGNAGTQVSGPWRCRHEPVMTKQLHTARAAQSGLLAAELAVLGFTGPEAILEGEQGFYAATSPDATPERVVDEPDAPWLMWETSFKPWPACRHAHAAIDAALEARARGITAERIDAITIACYRDAARFCDRAVPTTPHEAKFSLQHSVAVTLIDGPPGLESFAAEAFSRADVAALRERCNVAVAVRYDDAYPERYGSGLGLALTGSAKLEVDIPDALGDPENPLSDARIRHKADTLMAAAGLSSDARAALIDAALALAEGGTPESLFAALP